MARTMAARISPSSNACLMAVRSCDAVDVCIVLLSWTLNLPTRPALTTGTERTRQLLAELRLITLHASGNNINEL
jgi:hypothetical protein